MIPLNTMRKVTFPDLWIVVHSREDLTVLLVRLFAGFLAHLWVEFLLRAVLVGEPTTWIRWGNQHELFGRRVEYKSRD